MKINPKKYDRTIRLLCPICGNTEMEHSEESELIKCIGCGNEITKDSLIEENGESIDIHVDELKAEISKDVEKQLSDMLKKAFKGSKNIRIK